MPTPPTEVEIVWEDPPEAVSPLTQVIEQLKAHPNKWARVRVSKSSGGAYSTKKIIAKNPTAKGIEMKVVRLNEDGEHGLYARYIPNGERKP